MEKIGIFVASSIRELRKERLQLGDFVRRLNDLSMERDVYFRLILCEDESAAMADGRKQEEFNRQIRESRICLVLLSGRAGRYTVEEYGIAREQFLKTGAPAVLVFVRRDLEEPEQSLRDFLRRLEAEEGQSFRGYEGADSLKLSLLMQIKLLGLDLPVEFRGGRALVAGEPVLELDSLPALLKNTDFQRLRKELDRDERNFLAAKRACLEDPGQEAAFLAAAGKRDESRRALEELERELCSLMLSAEEQGARGMMTPRQRMAWDLMDQGRSREAAALLDPEEILSDAGHEEELSRQVREQLGRRVDELLQKAALLQSRPLTGDPLGQTLKAAAELEEKHALPPRALWEYCAFLHRQGEEKEAIRLAERLRLRAELEGEVVPPAEIRGALALLYAADGQTEKAAALYAGAGDSPAVCNDRGCFLAVRGSGERAEGELFKALFSAGGDPFVLSAACRNLGRLYALRGEKRRAGELEDRANRIALPPGGGRLHRDEDGFTRLCLRSRLPAPGEP